MQGDGQEAGAFHCDRDAGFALSGKNDGKTSGEVSQYHGLHIYPVRNDFFGERITVSGLITGQDLIAQLKGRNLWASRLLIPCNMFRTGEDVFLDDFTVEEVAEGFTSAGGYCKIKRTGFD